MAVAVYKNETLLGSGVTGVRKLGDATQASLADPWVLGACSKAMTATLAAMLVDEGKLDWQTPLDKLLPEASIHPTRAKITLEMLLQHHSGMERDPDAASLEKVAASKDPSRARKALVQKLLALPSPQPKGTYAYSNVAYLALGVALEVASGKTFEALALERLFVPLGMSSCGFGPPALVAPPTPATARPFGHAIKDGRLEAARPGAEARIAPAMAPTSSVHCSLADWAKFLRGHLPIPEGQRTLASRPSLDRLHTPAFDRKTTSGFSFEPGEWAGPVTLHQFGTSGTFFASTWLAPTKGLIFVLAVNADTPTIRDAAEKVENVLFKRFAK